MMCRFRAATRLIYGKKAGHEDLPLGSSNPALLCRFRLWFGRGVPLYGFAIDLNPCDVGIPACAVAASRHKVREADLIDFAEVDLIQKSTFRYHLLDIQFEPVKLGEVELAFVEIERVGVNMVPDEPRFIREFYNRPDFVETRSLGQPAELRLAGQIDVAVLVPERQSASLAAASCPDVG